MSDDDDYSSDEEEEYNLTGKAAHCSSSLNVSSLHASLGPAPDLAVTPKTSKTTDSNTQIRTATARARCASRAAAMLDGGRKGGGSAGCAHQCPAAPGARRASGCKRGPGSKFSRLGWIRNAVKTSRHMHSTHGLEEHTNTHTHTHTHTHTGKELDLYNVLGITRPNGDDTLTDDDKEATHKGIVARVRSAYHRRATKWHPSNFKSR
jgi:hypothetical protein